MRHPVVSRGALKRRLQASSLRDERGNVVLRMGDPMSVRVEIHAGLA